MGSNHTNTTPTAEEHFILSRERPKPKLIQNPGTHIMDILILITILDTMATIATIDHTLMAIMVIHTPMVDTTMANKYLVKTEHGLNEGLNQLPSIIKQI